MAKLDVNGMLVEVPGAWTYVEGDMREGLADSKSINSDSGSPIIWWLVVAALVPVTALTGVAALRRKR